MKTFHSSFSPEVRCPSGWMLLDETGTPIVCPTRPAYEANKTYLYTCQSPDGATLQASWIRSVPEPSGTSMLLAGVILLALLARRR